MRVSIIINKPGQNVSEEWPNNVKRLEGNIDQLIEGITANVVLLTGGSIVLQGEDITAMQDSLEMLATKSVDSITASIPNSEYLIDISRID